jgi:hypothetical protein
LHEFSQKAWDFFPTLKEETDMFRKILDTLAALKPASPFTPCNAGWPKLGEGSVDDSGDLWRRDIRSAASAA